MLPATPSLGFLSLPPEIRNIIYFLALFDPTDRIPLERHFRTHWPAWPFYHHIAPASRPPTSRLALLATCRAIHAEAAPIFYGNATFELTDPLPPRWTLPWLRTIGQSNAAAVRFLAVNARERARYRDDDSARWSEAWASAAAACPNVEVLEFRRTSASDGGVWALDDGRLGGLVSGLRGVWPRLRVVRLLDLPSGQDELLGAVARRVGCTVQAARWNGGVLEAELEAEPDGEPEEEKPRKWAHDVVIRHLLRQIRP